MARRVKIELALKRVMDASISAVLLVWLSPLLLLIVLSIQIGRASCRERV